MGWDIPAAGVIKYGMLLRRGRHADPEYDLGLDVRRAVDEAWDDGYAEGTGDPEGGRQPGRHELLFMDSVEVAPGVTKYGFDTGKTPQELADMWFLQMTGEYPPGRDPAAIAAVGRALDQGQPIPAPGPVRSWPGSQARDPEPPPFGVHEFTFDADQLHDGGLFVESPEYARATDALRRGVPVTLRLGGDQEVTITPGPPIPAATDGPIGRMVRGWKAGYGL